MKIHLGTLSYLYLLSLLLGCSPKNLPPKITTVEYSDRQKLLSALDSLERVLDSERGRWDLDKMAVPGQAYARCFVAAQLEIVQSPLYPVYTGNVFDQEAVEEVEIEVEEYYTNWQIVKSADLCGNNADEKEINDCTIWHYKEYPAQYKTVYIVSDTTKLKEFRLRTFDQIKVVKKGKVFDRYSTFRCPRPEKYFYLAIQNALRSKGYNLEGARHNSIDAITKNALIDYQKKNGLSVGQVDSETLKSLGIKD